MLENGESVRADAQDLVPVIDADPARPNVHAVTVGENLLGGKWVLQKSVLEI